MKRLQEAFFLVDSRCFHRPAKTDNSRNGGAATLRTHDSIIFLSPFPLNFFKHFRAFPSNTTWNTLDLILLFPEALYSKHSLTNLGL